MNILLIILLVGVFIVGRYFAYKHGYREGFIKGVQEEQLVMTVAIARAYKDDQEEAINKVKAAYKQLHLEIEQDQKDKDASQV